MEHSFHMTTALAAPRIDSILHLRLLCCPKAKICISWGEGGDESGAIHVLDAKNLAKM